MKKKIEILSKDTYVQLTSSSCFNILEIIGGAERKCVIAVSGFETCLYAVSDKQWFETQGSGALQARNHTDIWFPAHLIPHRPGKCWSIQITGSHHNM